MKRLGIIGGTGPESTIDYYRLIIAGYRAKRLDGSYPQILINSIDNKRMLDLTGANRLDEVTDLFVTELGRLARAGADFALLAANTSHIVFDAVQARSPLPLLSIVEATCDVVYARKLTRVGLIGTRYTMQGRFYMEVFARRGITVVAPPEEDQAYIHEKYLSELTQGIFLPETRAGLLDRIQRLTEHEGIQGVILGGTELPLILRDAPLTGIPFFDTAKIHTDRAVEEILS